jgi:hypothetical protein
MSLPPASVAALEGWGEEILLLGEQGGPGLR